MQFYYNDTTVMYNGYMSEMAPKSNDSGNNKWEILEQESADSEQSYESGWDSLANYEQPPHVEIIDMTKIPEGKLSSDFSSGVYLFHGARTANLKEIFSSGAIMNAGALYEQNKENLRSQLESEGKSEEEIEKALNGMGVIRNSGQEGISWSSNGIDALPGETGHIAGFVAAPELVLGDNKLVVPSRPAPYELLQVSGNIDGREFFEAKKQFEVWGYKEAPISEKASIDSGLMYLYQDNAEAKKPESERNQFLKRSLLGEFAEKGGLPADELRKHFQITEDGHVRLDEQLHQQKFNENYLPPAAVWLQAMVDKGMFKSDNFKNTPLEGSDFEGMDVSEIIKETRNNDSLLFYTLFHARKESEKYLKEYDEELEKAKPVKATVESMYFVTNKKDLSMWMDEIEKSGHYPKGILLYDDKKVVNPNFASVERGDHAELANEIGRAVGADGDFWQREMGMDVVNLPRAGSRDQALREDAVKFDTEIKAVDGKLVFEKND